MKVKAKMFLAKLLIVFSVVFIGTGIWLTYIEEQAVLHPVKDVTVVAEAKSETISVTTVSQEEGDKSSQTVDSSQAGNVDLYAPSVESINTQLRNLIQNNYGVTVKFGSEVKGYSVGGMSTAVVSDPNISKAALVNLNIALSLYPEGFFQEMNSKGYPLTFYVLKNYSTKNVTGVTDSSSKNIVISVATDYDFVDTIHHEVYHYIEKYMIKEGAAFTSWDLLNPAKFKYGVIEANYAYARTFSEEAFFVNSYAMTDQYEDRASTFEYMMKQNKASCLNHGKTVWLKAKTMSETIDYFFSSVTPEVTEYWERHVY